MARVNWLDGSAKGDEAGEEVALGVGGWGGNCEFTLGPC